MSDISRERWVADGENVWAEGGPENQSHRAIAETGVAKAIAVLPEALALLHRYVRGEATRSEAWDILDRAGVLK